MDNNKSNSIQDEQNVNKSLEEVAYTWYNRFKGDMNEADWKSYHEDCRLAGVTSLEVSEYIELYIDKE